jgi:hypothetical protein
VETTAELIRTQSKLDGVVAVQRETWLAKERAEVERDRLRVRLRVKRAEALLYHIGRVHFGKPYSPKGDAWRERWSPRIDVVARILEEARKELSRK